MSILDRAREAFPVRIDTAQLADEPGTTRVRLDQATELARNVRRDLVKAGGDLHIDDRMDEIGGRIRGAASTPRLQALVARLERDWPGTDRDRYDRAYARGWVHGRTAHLAVGFAAGIGVGLVAAVLLDPKRGKARRERIAARAGSLTRGLTGKAGGSLKGAEPVASVAPVAVEPETLGGTGTPVEAEAPAEAAPPIEPEAPVAVDGTAQAG
ncbi:MAG: hypothetical protein MUQ32_04040 [Chloroflexi bacterium]|nr:hypothetical protein [Chloroflexota bacterium]